MSTIRTPQIPTAKSETALAPGATPNLSSGAPSGPVSRYRRSTLVSSLAPSTLRLRRAANLLSSHGKPVIDLHAAVEGKAAASENEVKDRYGSRNTGGGGSPDASGPMPVPSKDEEGITAGRRDVAADDAFSGNGSVHEPTVVRSVVGSLRRRFTSKRKQASSISSHEGITSNQPPAHEGNPSRESTSFSRAIRRWRSGSSTKLSGSKRTTDPFDPATAENSEKLASYVASPTETGDAWQNTLRPYAGHLSIESIPKNEQTRHPLGGNDPYSRPEDGRGDDLQDLGLVYVDVPDQWIEGVVMLKVSAKGQDHRTFRIDPEQELILWESKKGGVISIRKIQELRTGPAAEYWREHFGFGPEFANRWITISYLVDMGHRTLHLVAPTPEVFQQFHRCVSGAMELRRAMLALLSNHPLSPKYVQNPGSIEGDPYLQLQTDAEPGRSSGGLDRISPARKSQTSKLINRHLSHEERQMLWERYYWRVSDTSRNRRIEFSELERMADRLSLGINKTDLERIFIEMDLDGDGSLSFPDFQRVWRKLMKRKDIIWMSRDLGLCDEKGEITFERFEGFMRNEQKDTRPRTELHRLFCSYTTSASSAAMSLDAFTAYLMSFDNSPFEDHNRGVNQDMNRPLSEYFISCSHNTYLVGSQVIGDSTIEGYIIALLNSCRCVEIDIYDGETEPIITHGGTLTSKVPLRDICVAIARHAFIKSPYPVIISAEVHCRVSQQAKIAEIMKECFGERLVDKRLKGSLASPNQLPSPEMLRGKILLKAKNPMATEPIATDSMTSLCDSTSETDPNADAAGISASRSRSRSPDRRSSWSISLQQRRSRSPMLRSFTASSSAEPIPFPLDGQQEPYTADPARIYSRPPTSQGLQRMKSVSLDLTALLIYTIGVKCRGLSKRQKYAVEHMFSLSEKKVEKILKEGINPYGASAESLESANAKRSSGEMMDLIRHTRDHLVKVYPKGTRVMSTNYLPQRYWATGAQLLALNWQTADLGYVINRSCFMRNGQSGYVLKPRSLLEGNEEALFRRKRYILNVKIISGQQIPRRKPRSLQTRNSVAKSVMDPYVQLVLHTPDLPRSFPSKSGHAQSPPNPTAASEAGSNPVASNVHHSLDPQGSGTLKVGSKPSSGTPVLVQAKTSPVKNNGFDPVWQESLHLEFEVAGDMLDLVFAQFIVKDETYSDYEHSLAMYCISLGCIRQGYRHLPLYDQQMTPFLFASLFVHIDLQEQAA